MRVRVGVVGVGVAVADQLLADGVELWEVVTRVGDLIWIDAEEGEVVEDGLLKLSFRF